MGYLLVYKNGDNRPLAMHEVGAELQYIGRLETCEIQLLDPAVSRKHAVIVAKGLLAGIRDLGSANGITVNEHKVTGSARLANGDRIGVCGFTLEYYDHRPSVPAGMRLVSSSHATSGSGLHPCVTEVHGKNDLPGTPPIKLPSPPPITPAPAALAAALSSGEPADPPVAARDAAVAPVMAAPAPVEPARSIEKHETPVIRAEAGRPARPASDALRRPPPEPAENDEENEEEPQTTSYANGGEDAALAVGEFEQADAFEDIEMVGGGGEGLERLTLPEPLRLAIERRLAAFARLDALEEDRRRLLAGEELGEEVLAELRRQTREAQLPPSIDRARALYERLCQKREEQVAAVAADPAAALSAPAEAARELGIAQLETIISHAELLEPALAEAGDLALGEPFRLAADRQGLDTRRLFALAFYQLALEAELAAAAEVKAGLKEGLDRLSHESRGFFGRLRGADPDQAERERLQEQDRQCGARLLRLRRELSGLLDDQVAAFWEAYGQAARILVTAPPGGSDETVLRAFLRYGLLGHGPCFQAPELTGRLLAECAEARTEWQDGTRETHLLYADEYIQFAAQGRFTASPDENLELSERNSPAWKADKLRRRLIHSRLRMVILGEVRSRLARDVTELEREQARLEDRRDKLSHGDPDYKRLKSELGQQIQGVKVKIGRLTRSREHVENVLLPRLEQVCEESECRLLEAGASPSPREIAVKEAVGVRRVTRLTANLKEVFLPLALREHYRPEQGLVNGRAEMLKELAALEKLDPAIFLEPLFNVKKREHRIYMRFCPVILLTPGCGFLGYAWNPRAGAETGRLVLPGYCPRSGLRERMLHHLLADFRWNTSVAEAGVDMLNSDTLSAAYATLRWEYRHRAREAREKASVYLEETDRKNWRRHYGLYLQSALEGGRRLCHKCPEAHAVILKYLDLPEGVEAFRR